MNSYAKRVAELLLIIGVHVQLSLIDVDTLLDKAVSVLLLLSGIPDLIRVLRRFCKVS